MTSNEIRQKFLDFFQKRGHTVIPSASLVPTEDPTVLFNTAGMQPLMPYFFGKVHPSGDKLVDSQKCVRTVDIEGIGDKTHATFFEMLGNWSLGSYYKKEAIEWSFQFLTSKEEGLGLDPKRLYITCFVGDTNVPKDTESLGAWTAVGIPENRIYFKGVDSNWWPAVEKEDDSWTGPTGACTEMFYDMQGGLGDLTLEEFEKADEEQKVIEVWNDVFMEYEKKEGKIVGSLSQKNVDTGAGFERVLAVVQEKDSIFDTDLWRYIMPEAEKITDNQRSQRIVADHFRTSSFIIADGIIPSNTDRGYILRRLIRRAVLNTKEKGIKEESVQSLVQAVVETYAGVYDNLSSEKVRIISEIKKKSKNSRKQLWLDLSNLKKSPHPTFQETRHLIYFLHTVSQ